MRQRLIFLLVAVLAVGLAIGVASLWPIVPDPVPEVTPVTHVYSNIHPNDYVGPDACRDCHADHFHAWSQHSHSRMNQNASAHSVVGDFSGREVEYGNGRVVFEERDGQYLMSLFQGQELVRQYRVTRTVGSRIEQMYIGVQTQGPEPAGHAAYSSEGKLPFGYWMSRRAWFPESYFDSDRPPEPDDDATKFAELSQVHGQTQWGMNCIYCHNTYPYQHRIFFEDGSGFPTSDLSFPHGTGVVAEWGPTTPEKLVTLGVSCESCHFGGREHAMERRESKFVPCSSELSLRGRSELSAADATQDPYVINSICAQCHCAKISRYPNGAGTWNSREALDMISGACANAIKCTDCHDPHRSISEAGLRTETRSAEACLRCHAEFQTPEKLAAHTRHPDAAHVSCMDCHMPRIVQGLEAVMRTHHISSPTDERMLSRGAPNACNLCHLDRSLRWTVAGLDSGWGRTFEDDSHWAAAYGGDANRPVGEAWLEHERPIVRLIAADAYARHASARDELPTLLRTLNDGQAVNRMFGLFAVEKIIGRQLTEAEYSPLASASVRREQVQSLVERSRELLLESDSAAAQASPVSPPTSE